MNNKSGSENGNAWRDRFNQSVEWHDGIKGNYVYVKDVEKFIDTEFEFINSIAKTIQAQLSHLQNLCEDQARELEQLRLSYNCEFNENVKLKARVEEQKLELEVERGISRAKNTELLEMSKVIEEQRGEIAELKFLLMQTEAELTLRNGQLDKVRFQSDIYAKQVELKEELINERSSQLATQTERVQTLEKELEALRGKEN